MKHSVRSRLKKPWFSPPVIVFDLIAHDQVWYDPSYGNGGGDYRDRERTIATYATAEEATIARDILNEYKGEK